jgi:hypothetical protein
VRVRTDEEKVTDRAWVEVMHKSLNLHYMMEAARFDMFFETIEKWQTQDYIEIAIPVGGLMLNQDLHKQWNFLDKGRELVRNQCSSWNQPFEVYGQLFFRIAIMTISLCLPISGNSTQQFSESIR